MCVCGGAVSGDIVYVVGGKEKGMVYCTGIWLAVVSDKDKVSEQNVALQLQHMDYLFVLFLQPFPSHEQINQVSAHTHTIPNKKYSATTLTLKKF